MINTQRVRRIRGAIYTCILLIIFIPVILMLVVSFKTLFVLSDLKTVLSHPSIGTSDPSPAPDGGEAGSGVSDENGGQEFTSTLGLQDAESEDPDSPFSSQGLSGGGKEEISGVAAPPSGSGGYVANTYLPATYPDLYFDTVPATVPPQSNTLYLTFDNTPSSQAEGILSVLQKHGVNATFFVWWNDSMDSKNLDFYRRIVEGGHQIGIHSASNTKTFSQLYSSVDGFLADYSSIFDAICDATGVKPRLYRLPGGSVNPQDSQRQRLLADIKTELDARGFRQHDWTASAEDAVNPSLSKEQILRNLEASMGRNGGIVVLLHDGTGSDSTAEALDEFIEKRKAENYAFGVLENDLEPVSFLDQ